MDLLNLEITVVSAEGLKKLDDHLSSKVKGVYVVVSLLCGVLSEQRAKTNVDMEESENPRWNFPMKFLVDRNANDSLLTFSLKSENSKDEHKTIGEIKVPIAELMNSVGDQNSMQYVSRPIMTSSSSRLNFIFKFEAIEAQQQALLVRHDEEIMSHLNTNNVRDQKSKKEMMNELAKSVAISSTTDLVGDTISDAAHAVVAHMTHVEDSTSDQTATSITETANNTPSDTAIVDPSSTEDGHPESRSGYDVVKGHPWH